MRCRILSFEYRTWLMLKKLFASMAAVAVIAGATVWAAEKAEVKLEGITCVVAPKAAKADKTAAYKEGNVYFCCGNCLGKFTAAPEKFTEKANMQLVATKQYKQKSCPLSGGKLNPETLTKVGDAEVAFCCNNCKGKVDAAEDAEKLTLVFSDKAFEKAGFAPKKKKKAN